MAAIPSSYQPTAAIFVPGAGAGGADVRVTATADVRVTATGDTRTVA